MGISTHIHPLRSLWALTLVSECGRKGFVAVGPHAPAGGKGRLSVLPCQVPIKSLALLLSLFSSFCPQILDSEFMLDDLLRGR